MLIRILTASALSFVLIAGAFAVAERIAVAQAPGAPAADQPAVVAAPIPATPAPVTAAPLPPPIVAAPAPAAAAPSAPPTAAAPAHVAATPAPAAPVSLANIPMPPEKPSMAEDKQPAKQLFSHVELPSLGKAVAIGYYPRGCLQGGVELPVTGPNWQVMRLSRNRNWGHPELVKFLERFAPLAAKATGWHGILVGDMAQPRGGPLPFGHMSHQIGLDVDIWFMPEPDHTLSKDEREKISATNLVADDWKHINPKTWSAADIAFIRTAAEQPEVERVLVNAAIKKQLCLAKDKERWSWLDKVRPWYGHHDHIHVRLKCPADSPNCRKQPPVPGDDGCADKELAYWFSDKVLHPKITEPKKPPRALTLADLPPACKTVLDAPANPKAAAR
jgi:penicillin-insensitive murein endopeptidase